MTMTKIDRITYVNGVVMIVSSAVSLTVSDLHPPATFGIFPIGKSRCFTP